MTKRRKQPLGYRVTQEYKTRAWRTEAVRPLFVRAVETVAFVQSLTFQDAYDWAWHMWAVLGVRQGY